MNWQFAFIILLGNIATKNIGIEQNIISILICQSVYSYILWSYMRRFFSDHIKDRVQNKLV